MRTVKRQSALQKEILQRSPFASLEQETSLGVVRTASLLRRAITKVVSPFGITQPQYNVLRILRGAGKNGLPTLEVRSRMVDEAPGITRLVNKLERAGLLRRERSTPDRRQVICVISAKGLDVLAKIDPLIGIADNVGIAGLTRQEQRTVVRLLDKVRNSIRADEL